MEEFLDLDFTQLEKSHKRGRKTTFSPFGTLDSRSNSLHDQVDIALSGQSEQSERSLTQTTAYNGNLRLGYSPNWGGFDLSADWRYRHSENQLRQTSTYTRNYSFSLNAYAELSLTWTDILSDRKSFYSNVTSSGLSENHSQQIGGYFMVAFKWRFNKQL